MGSPLGVSKYKLMVFACALLAFFGHAHAQTSSQVGEPPPPHSEFCQILASQNLLNKSWSTWGLTLKALRYAFDSRKFAELKEVAEIQRPKANSPQITQVHVERPRKEKHQNAEFIIVLVSNPDWEGARVRLPNYSRDDRAKARKLAPFIQKLMASKDQSACDRVAAASAGRDSEALKFLRSRLSPDYQEFRKRFSFQFARDAAEKFAKRHREPHRNPNLQVEIMVVRQLKEIQNILWKRYPSGNANVALVVHADETGSLYDYQQTDFPNRFFWFLSPDIRSLGVYGCYGAEVADRYFPGPLRVAGGSAPTIFVPVLKRALIKDHLLDPRALEALWQDQLERARRELPSRNGSFDSPSMSSACKVSLRFSNDGPDFHVSLAQRHLTTVRRDQDLPTLANGDKLLQLYAPCVVDENAEVFVRPVSKSAFDWVNFGNLHVSISEVASPQQHWVTEDWATTNVRDLIVAARSTLKRQTPGSAAGGAPTN